MHKCNFEFEKKDRNEDFYQNSEYEKKIIYSLKTTNLTRY